MSVLTNGQQVSKPKTPKIELDPSLLDFYMLRRKQIIEEARYLESLLLESGKISRRMVLMRSPN